MKAFLRILKDNFTKYSLSNIGNFILALLLTLVIALSLFIIMVAVPGLIIWVLYLLGVRGFWLIVPIPVIFSIVLGVSIQDEYSPKFTKPSKWYKAMLVLVSIILVNGTILESILIAHLFPFTSDNFIMCILTLMFILFYINTHIIDIILKSYKQYKEIKNNNKF